MKIAILGYGVEGKVNYKYWKELGDDVVIVDESENVQDIPPTAKAILGKSALDNLHGFDLVVRTPQLRPDKITTTGKIWSASNEFFAQCPAPIIGVTGTKGKGTTASLITEILKAAGSTVHLVGNIGVPALEILPKIKPADFVVFELSSFQLWDLQKCPETSIVLMIEPDHMDIHVSLDEYIAAKANITNHQTADDLLVYHPTNVYAKQIAALSTAGTKKRYMSPEGARVSDNMIEIIGHQICDVSEVGLIGAHNLENICAAITAAWRYTQNTTAIKQAITSFKGLPHRLEFAGEVNSIKYYDDSQATGVGSALAALRAFKQPTVLILGGSDKGADVSPVVNELDPERHSVILIGQGSSKLEEHLKVRQFKNYVNLGQSTTMPEIVKVATEHAVQGGVVLLSPAHASFDMFKSYQDRGDQFKAAIKTLLT